MSTKKAPPKKPAIKTPAKSGKAALDKAAADLRKLKADAKTPKGKKAPPAPSSAKDGGKLEIIAPVKPSLTPIVEILRDRVNIADDFSSLNLRDETTISEFLPIFDHFGEVGRKYQFVLGDLYNEGFRLYGDTFAHQMAASGRPVSTLKKWGSIAANVPPNLRNLHPKLEWSHCAEVATLPDVKDKKEILTEAAKEAKAGKVPAVKVIRERVQKIKPKQKRKPKAAKKKKDATPKRIATFDERDAIIAMEDVAAKLESLIGAASFCLEINTDETATLREKLGAAARFLAQITP